MLVYNRDVGKHSFQLFLAYSEIVLYVCYDSIALYGWLTCSKSGSEKVC